MEKNVFFEGVVSLPRVCEKSDSGKVVRVHIEGKLNMASEFGSPEGGMLTSMGVNKFSEKEAEKSRSYMM